MALVGGMTIPIPFLRTRSSLASGANIPCTSFDTIVDLQGFNSKKEMDVLSDGPLFKATTSFLRLHFLLG